MKVFYRQEQTARNAAASSPSAAKPQAVVEDWLRRELISSEDVMSFEPVTRQDLKLAHDPAMVDGILDLTRNNGFRNRDAEVAASLPYTTGSLVAAARHALQSRETVCSPTSGFHHAGFDKSWGYCTFNGLVVAAMMLKREGLIDRLAILDCDMHFGDGTADLLSHHGIDWVQHHTQGASFNKREDAGPSAKHYFKWLDKALVDCQSADLVIYQAGADPHIADPLGGLLSEKELAQRDLTVFKALDGKPVVWNLAGGYQRDDQGGIRPVLALHRNTLLALKAVRPNERSTA